MFLRQAPVHSLLMDLIGPDAQEKHDLASQGVSFKKIMITLNTIKLIWKNMIEKLAHLLVQGAC